MAPQQKRQKNTHNKKREEKDTEEKNLESLLFGGSDDIWAVAGKEHDLAVEDTIDDEDDTGSVANDDQEDAFFFDAGPVMTNDTTMEDSEVDYEATDDSANESDKDSDDDDSDDEQPLQQKTAWKDDDDNLLEISLTGTNRLRKLRKHDNEETISGMEYERRLRRQFNKMHPPPTWAQLPSEKNKMAGKRKNDGDSDESDYESNEPTLNEDDRLDLLKSTLGILEKRKGATLLSPDYVAIHMMKDANIMARSKQKITSVQFHPDAQVLLTAGLDRTLRLFQIDGKVNHKIQSVFLPDTPIYSAQFHTSGDQIIATGRRPHIYIYDIQSGKVEKSPGIWGREETSWEKFSISPCGRYMALLGGNGNIVLVSYLTKQWIANLRMNGRVECISWSADGNYLYSSGVEGIVYQWDVGQRACIHKWIDDGSLETTSIDVSPNEKYYATGSTSGIVNIYDESALTRNKNSDRPAPYKTIGNLTTGITNLKFNFDSQLLAISSSLKKDALKLIHTPTGRVVMNWPTERTPLGRVTALDFSPNSDYLAVGNKQGRVLLFNIKDYALN